MIKYLTRRLNEIRRKVVTCRLQRYLSDNDTTLGRFYVQSKFICYTVEDQENSEKVYAETRIPEGEYQIDYRYEGRFHNSYKKRFSWHKGILCIFNSPNWFIRMSGYIFQYVLLHIGNTDDDSAGCILPNTTVDEKLMRGYGSTDAYEALYKEISSWLDKGYKVRLIIEDVEKSKS